MNRLSSARRLEILLWLCRGASLRGATRSSGISINTVTKLLVDAGGACAALHDQYVRAVRANKIICIKIWSPIIAPGVNTRKDAAERAGVWVWIAWDCDSNLIIAYHVGMRGRADAAAFLSGLGARLLATIPAVNEEFLARMIADDAAFCIQLATAAAGRKQDAFTVASAGEVGFGERMLGRRFTRLRNGYCRKSENLAHMIAIFLAWHNFARGPANSQTPAMKSGLTGRKWTMAEIAELPARAEPARIHTGPAPQAAGAASGRPA